MHYRSDIRTGTTASPYCDVEILEQDAPARSGTLLGTMEIDDSGVSTNCHKRTVIKILREEACRIGADVIVLYNIRKPDSFSSCYRVMADFVRLEEGEEYIDIDTDTTETQVATKPLDARVLPDGDSELSEPKVNKSSDAFDELRPCLTTGCSLLGIIFGLMLSSSYR